MNKDEQALLAKAALYQERQLPKAIAIYQQLLQSAPNNLQVTHALSFCLAKQGKLNEAIKVLQQIISNLPHNASLQIHLANLYKQKQDLKKANRHFHEALRIEPNYPEAHHDLAILYASQNLYSQAIKHYRLALHAEPTFVKAHFNLGLLLLKINELDAARKQFNNVVALEPEHMRALFFLGGLNLAANHLAKAAECFQTILAKDQSNTEVLNNLGVIALKRQEAQQAVHYFTQVLSFDNNNIEARNNLAATFMHFDRFENALMHYDVLLKNDPSNIEYLYNSGVAQMALGHLREAISHFNTILAQDSKHFAALSNLAAIYIRLEDLAKATELLKNAVDVNPADPISRHMLAALTVTGAGTTCPEYARNLFNNYALYYDAHMRGALRYALPQKLKEVIYLLNIKGLAQALDLGCGTGLSGEVLRPITKYLTGVDIAAKMLAQAKLKGMYDKLVESELTSFLNKNTKQKYNLIVAIDVLPYFGDLAQIFAAIKKTLAINGYFIFTVEIGASATWQLAKTARFAHNPDYIKNLCIKYNLAIIYQAQIVARQQYNLPLLEILFVAHLVDLHPR